MHPEEHPPKQILKRAYEKIDKGTNGTLRKRRRINEEIGKLLKVAERNHQPTTTRHNYNEQTSLHPSQPETEKETKLRRENTKGGTKIKVTEPNITEKNKKAQPNSKQTQWRKQKQKANPQTLTRE